MNKNGALFSALKIILILLSSLFIMTGCNDDDFATYDSFIEELAESFSANENHSLADIIPTANEIAGSYSEHLNLVKIIVRSADFGLSGDIRFIYSKVHEQLNQATSIELAFDFQDQMFYQIAYTQGHGKRVSVITEPLGDIYLNVPIGKLFDLDEVERESYKIIRIELSLDRVNIFQEDFT
ncbi:MAG: hypothetical protein FWG87_01850 [Defluviitaleaceae bacterium]|nr:hypothetical protein [Defluviitaleaceae bacterium]